MPRSLESSINSVRLSAFSSPALGALGDARPPLPSMSAVRPRGVETLEQLHCFLAAMLVAIEPSRVHTTSIATVAEGIERPFARAVVVSAP